MIWIPGAYQVLHAWEHIPHLPRWQHPLVLVLQHSLLNPLSFDIQLLPFFRYKALLKNIPLSEVRFFLLHWALYLNEVLDRLHYVWLPAFALEVDEEGVLDLVDVEGLWFFWFPCEFSFWPALADPTVRLLYIPLTRLIRHLLLLTLHTINLVYQLLLSKRLLRILRNNQKHLFISVTPVTIKVETVEGMVVL